MLNLSLTIGKFHPAVVRALICAVPENKLVSKPDFIAEMQSRVEACIEEGRKSSLTSFRANEKETKKNNSWSVNLTGSVKGIKLPDSPVGLLARLNTYLEGSREYYVRVEEIVLPASVLDYAKEVHGKMVEQAKAPVSAS